MHPPILGMHFGQNKVFSKKSNFLKFRTIMINGENYQISIAKRLK